MSIYLLAAVRREHRRLAVVCQSLDRRNTPKGVVLLLEDAMLTLDDAAQALEQHIALNHPQPRAACHFPEGCRVHGDPS